MDDIQPETTLDRAIRWNINQLEEKIDTARVYKKNLEKIFYKEFQTEYCQINTDSEDVSVTLHLSELTQDDIQKVNEIASLYIIESHNCDVFLLRIFQFKGVDE